MDRAAGHKHAPPFVAACRSPTRALDSPLVRAVLADPACRTLPMLLLKRLVGSILIVFGVLVAVMGTLALAPPPDAQVDLGVPLALLVAGVGVAIGLFGERVRRGT